MSFPAVSRVVWESRYRWAAERDLGDTCRRVARAVAAVETGASGHWARRFESVLRSGHFLPGGRILAGAGTDRQVTLFNCFVMGVIEDSVEGIFEALKEGALTMQAGGGTGYDFSTLRPCGSAAQRSGTIASGPVSFMRMWDAMCATMLSTGARRGAMMATLRCDHPDIEAFIDAKREPGVLRHFNLSVQVTDEFLAAVQTDDDWPLVFPGAGHALRGPLIRRTWTGQASSVDCEVLRTVKARALWQRILQAAYDSAEPGLLFVDRINRENNLHHIEHLTCTNPCGEIPLPPYGACNLGSLNLAAFVIEPFEPGARMDYAALAAATETAVRFLDDVIDLSSFPLARQRACATRSRRLGLGITGLADALAMLGHRYDSWTGRGMAEDLMQCICIAAYEASCNLAAERGTFPAFDRDACLAAPFIGRLPEKLRDRIARQGLRNSHLLAIAPAGTISLLAGNVSSGIEPIFAMESERRILGADGEYQPHRVTDYAWALWKRLHPEQSPPDALAHAEHVDGRAQIAMQAVLQPWVDNAISKTISVPADMPFDEFGQLYTLAHQQGLKGCTVFRPNPVRGAVLSTLAPAGDTQCCDIEREAD